MTDDTKPEDRYDPDDLLEAGAAIDFLQFEDSGTFILQGNAAGLRKLARILLDLAERQPGAHQHFEDWSGLNLGSLPLISQHGMIQQE